MSAIFHVYCSKINALPIYWYYLNISDNKNASSMPSKNHRNRKYHWVRVDERQNYHNTEIDKIIEDNIINGSVFVPSNIHPQK